jgi:hypothetical protein
MTPGTPFIYYRGTRAKKIGLSGPAYFGCGVVGPMSDARNNRLQVEILDYFEFPIAVDFKSGTGEFLEPLAAERPVYFQQGIRSIDEDAFKTILELAAAPSIPDTNETHLSGPGYSRSSLNAALVDEYAISVAVDRFIHQFGSGAVTVMPHNNPGFDLLVQPDKEPEFHVEVKGTRSNYPVFFLTEGERIHSSEQPEAFKLCVVYSINLTERTHEVLDYEGEISDQDFLLQPRQWQVRLRG